MGINSGLQSFFSVNYSAVCVSAIVNKVSIHTGEQGKRKKEERGRKDQWEERKNGSKDGL